VRDPGPASGLAFKSRDRAVQVAAIGAFKSAIRAFKSAIAPFKSRRSQRSSGRDPGVQVRA